jgi:hypothetical protein
MMGDSVSNDGTCTGKPLPHVLLGTKWHVACMLDK